MSSSVARATADRPIYTPEPVASGAAPVHIRHFGGAGEVGGTSYEVRCWGVTILVDAGGRPKLHGNPFPDWSEGTTPDMILVTHAHFDHVGGLPVLFRHLEASIADIPVYCSPLTRDLARYILVDSARVQRARERASLENPLLPPVRATYTEAAAQSAADRLIELPMYEPITRAYFDRGVKVTVHPVAAGHIPGAVSYLVTLTRVRGVGRNTTSETIRLALLGDIGDDATLAIDSVDAPAIMQFKPHVVVTESTYGAENLPDIMLERDRVRRSVAEVVREGGKVIIPAFALGRSTEVALIIRRANMRWRAYCSATGRRAEDWPEKNDPVWDLIFTDVDARWAEYCARTGRDPRVRPPANDPIWEDVDAHAMLPLVPCFLDGMTRAIATVCERHRHALSEPVQRHATKGGAIVDPFAFVFRYRHGLEKRADGRPFVVVSTSGMLTAGPVLRWIEILGANPKNAMFLSGYQDEESPGAAAKRLADKPSRGRTIEIEGNQYPLALRIGWFRLRAHASGPSITRLMMVLAPQHIVFAHGDVPAITALRTSVDQALSAIQAPTVTWAPANFEDLVLAVQPDTADATTVDIWMAAADRSVERVMRGASVDRVVQALRASPRATNIARDVALDVFGVPRDSLRREIAIRCVREVLEDNEGTWFDRRTDDGESFWQVRRSATVDLDSTKPSQTTELYWDAVDIPPAEAGIAVVRHRTHFPRLALIGPHECPDGEVVHPAVVALTREQRVRTRDVVLPISATSIGLNAWASSDKWASLTRRTLTDMQLGAEAMLANQEWKRDVLERNALDAAAVAARRAVWDAYVVTGPAASDLSEEGEVVLNALRDAVVGSGIMTTVTLSLRQLRTLLQRAHLLLRDDSYEEQFVRVLRGVNDARAVLGMTPVDASRLIMHYPFDVRHVIDEVNTYAPATGSQTASGLDEIERIAFALYQADVFIRVTQGDMRQTAATEMIPIPDEDAELRSSFALEETAGVV